MSQQTIVIFSHGFGIRSGTYGLFSQIIKEFDILWIQSILTEYCDYNESTQEVTVKPFSEQVKILQKTIDNTVEKNPEANIILIWQSQGATIISLCNTSKIKKIIMISPFYHTNKEDIEISYNQRVWMLLDFDNISYRPRTDRTTTIITPQYRQERFNTDIVKLYNKKALENDLTIFYWLQDQAMKFEQYDKIKNIFLMNMDGDHDFSKQYRQALIDKIKNIITL